MKKSIFLLLLIFINTCKLFAEAGKDDPANNNYYNIAFTEIGAMLDGKQPLSMKRAVFLQEWAYLQGQLNYDKYCKSIDTAVRHIKLFIKANKLEQYRSGGNYALFEYFSRPYSMNRHKPFVYDFEDMGGTDDFSNVFVTKLMRTHSGQCRSLPLYYKILADEIKAEAHLTLAPQHYFIKHRDENNKWVNVELTTASLSTEGFYITQFGITADAIRNKVYMYPLNDREMVAHIMSELASAYVKSYKQHDDFVMKCVEKALQYYPQDCSALWMKANVINEGIINYLKQGGKRTDSFVTEQDKLWYGVKAKVDSLGWTEMSDETYEQLLKGTEDAKKLQENK